jgi:hypothetical protein
MKKQNQQNEKEKTDIKKEKKKERDETRRINIQSFIRQPN